MANLKSFDGVLNRTKKDETKNAPLMNGQYIIEGQRKNVRDFGIRVLHHNVQSLFNKKNEITMMLAVDGMYINILCLTEHWLSEDPLKVIYILTILI